ncbi:hypothetical protein [Streptomyces sp. NPDC050535]|uniref:oxidoreductase n=1 Tax=Streptomyces sp. NPDC050535 TaxID=3365626 RepID=UPI00379A1B5D
MAYRRWPANADQRTDQWGGSPANRVRLTVEIVAAVTEAIGVCAVGAHRRLRLIEASRHTVVSALAVMAYRGIYRRGVEQLGSSLGS